jgi:histidinol-phosphatase (PHP family)
MELYAETAIAKGLKGIVFNEHAPLCRKMDSHFLTMEELELYLELGAVCREKYRGKLDITVGVEADYFPENIDFLSKLIDRYRFAYVSASIHFHLPFWYERIGEVTPDKRTELALLATRDAVRSGFFNTVNHLDFFRMGQTVYEPEKFKDQYCALFEEMVRHNVALEWNSSGFFREAPDAYPRSIVWEWSKAYPLRRTFGSDSHKAELIAYGLDRYPGE